MGGVTPLRNYSFPTYGDPTNFPQQQQLFANNVDLDIQGNIVNDINTALDAPSARASRPSGTQSIATGTNVLVSYTVENYDNAGFVNLAGSATDFTLNAGTYLLTGSINAQPDGSATGTAALIMQSSGGSVPNPVGTSRQLDNDKDTSLSCTTLHRVTGLSETINMFVRHSHGANLNFSIAQLTVTRIA